jgi:hypothetical protein
LERFAGLVLGLQLSAITCRRTCVATFVLVPGICHVQHRIGGDEFGRETKAAASRLAATLDRKGINDAD